MRAKVYILCIVCSATLLQGQSPQCPFTRGFNLAGWFQGASAGEISNVYTLTDLEHMMALGADHVRVPIDLYNLAGDGPGYVIDPILLLYLNRLVDWTEHLGLYIILDNHTHVPLSDDAERSDRLIALWQQMADHFKNRSELLHYEILNEPFGLADAEWGTLQRLVIEAIRAIDVTHTVIVAPNAMSHFDHLDLLPEYADANLIYTFHFYDPFLFTHQATNWTDPSMENLTGVPFPYDASRMPAMPAAFTGNWLGQLWEGYDQAGTRAALQGRMQIAVQFRDSRHVPIHCGELGVWQPGAVYEDRIQWHADIHAFLETDSIAWTLWGYKGGFGIYKENSQGDFPEDLDLPLLDALGLNRPGAVEIRPDTSGMILYDDLVDGRFFDGGTSGTLNLHDTGDPAQGLHCLHWTGATRYSAVTWRFTDPRDFSWLKDQGYRIRFQIKTDTPTLRFDLRFLDTDLSDGTDHPWRMVKTIDHSAVAMDGAWQEVDFALKDMIDAGAWHNGIWYNAENKFDWTRIDRFEIVAEHHDLNTNNLWLDEIEIYKEEEDTAVKSHSVCRAFQLHPPFPNPFNPQTRIGYELAESGPVEMVVYDLLGRKVQSLVNQNQSVGSYNIYWQGNDRLGEKVATGTYLIVLKTEAGVRVQKAVMLR